MIAVFGLVVVHMFCMYPPPDPVLPIDHVRGIDRLPRDKLSQAIRKKADALGTRNAAETVETIPPRVSHLTDLTNALPWSVAAPNIDTSIPPWMEAYVKFHNESLRKAHQQTKDTDQNKYLIFSCHKSCSGTGNRQRAIMASFIVAIITNRIFLIDITFPIQLELILQPNRIQWNWFPPHLKDLKSKLMKLRNKNPPVLDTPSKFQSLSHIPVLRIEANSPVNLEHQWRSPEVRSLLATHGVGRGASVPGNLYKQIFATLYRPSPRLVATTVALREQLGINSNNNNNTMIPSSSSSSSTIPYIVVHARTGGDGVGWKDADRFTRDDLDNLFGNAKMVRRGMLQSNNNNNSSFPIVVVSDDAKAKKILYDKDPTVVRYADTKIIHVDRSGPGLNDLEGSLAVWADVLIMAQATCIVKGRGSFSMLGAWLASRGSGPACMHLVI